MPLLSIEFLCFFLLFFPVYWSLRAFPYVQNALLLGASLAWLWVLDVWFVASVVGFSLVMSAVSFGVMRAHTMSRRKVWLGVGIGVAVLNLCFFKVNDFFLPELKVWLNEPLWEILMPLGVSYYTFQAIAYLCSLYRGEVVALKWYWSLLHYSSFLTVTSGPIARIHSFYHQGQFVSGMFHQLVRQTPRTILSPHIAVFLILLGILKKWWLAGFFAMQWVTPVFENPESYSLTELMLAIYGYTFQLYFDFSGYSDLVMGLGLLLGFELPRNFNMPFLARNLREFWARWHISLSTWIRDYVYIPLGGRSGGHFRTQLNVMFAMTLSGVWHGYGWNFLIWGALHGLGLVWLNLWSLIPFPKTWTAHWSWRVLAMMLTLSFVSIAFIAFNLPLEDWALLATALFENEQGWTVPDLWAIVIWGMVVGFLMGYAKIECMTQFILHQLSRRSLFFLGMMCLVWGVVLVLCAPSGIPGFIYANF